MIHPVNAMRVVYPKGDLSQRGFVLEEICRTPEFRVDTNVINVFSAPVR